jgi:uncharacterized membrane protein
MVLKHVCFFFDRCCFLTNSMEQGSSWKAFRPYASPETCCNLLNMKFRYHVCRSPPLVPILCQMNLVRTFQSCLFKTNFNTVIVSTSRLKVVPFFQVSSRILERIFSSHVPAVSASHRILIYMITAVISGVCTGHERHCAVASDLLLLHLRTIYLSGEPFIETSFRVTSE